MSEVRIIGAIALLLACGVTGVAQSLPAPPDADAPRFEVTSVKRNMTDPKDGIQGPRRVEGQRFVSIGWPMRTVVAMAYGARPFQIAGAPEWTETDFFDINATAPENTPANAILPMVRALLADRFRLQAHIEKREMPVYALVVERADGRLGPGMRHTTVDCVQLRADARTTPGRPGEFPFCASRLTARQLNGALMLEMAEGGIAMPSFVANISGYLDRLVIDRTGLTGDFDVRLEFAPPGGLAAASPDPGNAPLDTAPVLPAALQAQLGLRLQSDRALVDVLVIDSIDQPTPN
jgi:uncharacterized protein (TIGR03435 family)